MNQPTLCEHVRPGEWPFSTELVIDDHLGPTDALMRCRRCGRNYLLEMLDWQAEWRVMRVAALDGAQAERVVRDLTRGSCDIARAGAEVHHLRTQAPPSRRLVLMDTRGPAIAALADVPPDVALPGRSWRELPCDGSWVDYVRSNTDMV